MVTQFPAKINAGCPKAPRDFPPRKGGILYPRSGCLGTPLPLPQSLCGRTDVRTYGHVTITSEPKFLGSIGYQFSSAMELRWRALPAGFVNTHQKPILWCEHDCWALRRKNHHTTNIGWAVTPVRQSAKARLRSRMSLCFCKEEFLMTATLMARLLSNAKIAQKLLTGTRRMSLI